MTTPQPHKPPRSKVRTWSLATLDRNTEYLMFWHQGTKSWEVVAIDRSCTVVTRENIQERRRVRAGDATKGAERRGLSQATPSAAPAVDA